MKILVIDDDKELAESLKMVLEEHCFVVDTATDKNSGIFLAKTNEYDLLLLDLVLPEGNGLEICETIRKYGKNMPILVMSVRSEIPSKVALFNAGADDYVTKPFSFEELLARLKALMRRPQLMENELLNIKDLTLDVNKHIITRGKNEVYLTKKEFMLLKYLMQNQGIVLSRGMIMEHVWDSALDPFSNTIETHILTLRKKINSYGKEKLIKTIPGRGYKIS